MRDFVKGFYSVVRAFILLGFFAVGLFIAVWLARVIWFSLSTAVPSFAAQATSSAGFSDLSFRSFELRPWSGFLALLGFMLLLVSVYARRILNLVLNTELKIPMLTPEVRSFTVSALRWMISAAPVLFTLGLMHPGVNDGLNWLNNQYNPHDFWLLILLVGGWFTVFAVPIACAALIKAIIVDPYLPDVGTGILSQTLMVIVVAVTINTLWRLDHWAADSVLLAFGATGALALIGVFSGLLNYALGKFLEAKLHTKFLTWAKGSEAA